MATTAKWSSKASKNKNKIFDLTYQDIKEKWQKQNGICPYTGLKMTLPLQEDTSPITASLDRIDTNRGYTKDNVEIVCISINLAKNGFNKNVIVDFLEKIVQAKTIIPLMVEGNGKPYTPAGEL